MSPASISPSSAAVGAVSDFAGRTIVITGGASGIGYETAGLLAARGAALVLADMDEGALRQATDGLRGAGHRVTAVRGDVAEESDVRRLMSAAFKDATPDGLVNCAGIFPVTPLLELTVEEWARVMATNLSGPFLVTREFARRLIGAKCPGQVVNISSTASRLARPGIAHYGSSKAGLNQLTAIMAIELAPHDIRVNAVLPGVIGTETVLAATRTPAGAVETEAKLKKIPQGRLGEPRDIAEMIAFLLSPASGYCTGGLFTVDGGFTLGIPAY